MIKTIKQIFTMSQNEKALLILFCPELNANYSFWNHNLISIQQLQKCETDLQKVGYTTFFSIECLSEIQFIKPTENQMRVGPNYQRTDLTLSGCNTSIYKFGLSVCLFVCLYPINGWTDRAQIFFRTPHDPRDGFGWPKFQKFDFH